MAAMFLASWNSRRKGLKKSVRLSASSVYRYLCRTGGRGLLYLLGSCVQVSEVLQEVFSEASWDLER